MTKKQKNATFFAILAAALYALNAPISKILLEKISPTMMAGFLYLGAGIGLFIVGLIQKKIRKTQNELPLTSIELPYIIAMVALDIAAPIFFMLGLTMTSAANASLLNNFEIAATSLIALVVFKENISKRLWLAIALVTLSSFILSVEDISGFQFSFGSIFILLACVCWGFENNCTRKLSSKNPLQIVVIKGLCSGIGSIAIALAIKESIPNIFFILIAMSLGFVAYGLSIFFYIHAQRELGAATTSAYYAVAPFIGVALSLLLFWEAPTISFIIALMVMITGACLASTDT